MVSIPFPITQPYATPNPFEPECWYYPDTSIGYPGQVNGRRHNGIDYGAWTGTVVRAPRAGVVTFAGWDTTGFGNRVSVDCGAYGVLSGHLSRIDVEVGERVAAGQQLGLTGSTGNSTGPHLHYSLIDLDTGHYVNPAWGGDTLHPLLNDMPLQGDGGQTMTLTYHTMDGRARTVAAATDLLVPNITGYACRLTGALLALYGAASLKHGVACAALLAQGAQEAGFDPFVVSGDGGYGIAQWTYEPVARHYLGVPSGDWHPAALDPARAIDAQAWFMADLSAQYGSLHAALGAYNGGGNWASISAAVGYADGVLMRANGVERQLAALPDAAPASPPRYTLYRVLSPLWLHARPDPGATRGYAMIPHWECIALGPVTDNYLLACDMRGVEVGWVDRHHIQYEGQGVALPAHLRGDVRHLLDAGHLTTAFTAF